MRRRVLHTRGVALMEVLVAVTVLGVGMGVALESLANSARLQSHASKTAIARQLAEGQLVKLEIVGALAQSGVTAGAFDPPNEGYSWKLRVMDSMVNPNQRRIELSVVMGDAKIPLYTIGSYVLE